MTPNKNHPAVDILSVQPQTHRKVAHAQPQRRCHMTHLGATDQPLFEVLGLVKGGAKQNCTTRLVLPHSLLGKERIHVTTTR